MFWVLRSIVNVIRNEYAGWRKFREASGKWPACSILAAILSGPTLFVLVTYVFVATLRTGRLPLIYAGLFASVIFSGMIWYGLRRLASKVDLIITKAYRKAHSSENLEQLIR